ncbi:hypothetical protein ACIP6Q_04765 [Streptomyces bobili]|uniref:hypothetical protein n=1 Tax=Streptomyces bobili TaxID=67280 RepID=UPI0037F193EA
MSAALFAAALEWAWSLREPLLERVRPFVHGENARASAFYRQFGFEASGKVVGRPRDPTAEDLGYVFPRPGR